MLKLCFSIPRSDEAPDKCKNILLLGNYLPVSGEWIVYCDSSDLGVAYSAVEIGLAVLAHDDSRGERTVDKSWLLRRPLGIAWPCPDDLDFYSLVLLGIEHHCDVHVCLDRKAFGLDSIKAFVSDYADLPTVEKVCLVAAAPFELVEEAGDIRGILDHIACQVLNLPDDRKTDLGFTAELLHDLLVAWTGKDTDASVLQLDKAYILHVVGAGGEVIHVVQIGPPVEITIVGINFARLVADMRTTEDQLVADLCDIRIFKLVDHRIGDECPIILAGLVEEPYPGPCPFLPAFDASEDVFLSLPRKWNRGVVYIVSSDSMELELSAFVNLLCLLEMYPLLPEIHMFSSLFIGVR